jgi:hypothetical protein
LIGFPLISNNSVFTPYTGAFLVVPAGIKCFDKKGRHSQKALTLRLLMPTSKLDRLELVVLDQ